MVRPVGWGLKMTSSGLSRIAAAVMACLLAAAGARAQAVSVVLPAGAAAPIDGRLVLIVSPNAAPEPRLQVELEAPLRSPFMFGRNVEALRPGARVAIDEGAYGWPVRRLSALPPGDYIVQAVLNRYETFHRADGSTESSCRRRWARANSGTASPETSIRDPRACT